MTFRWLWNLLPTSNHSFCPAKNGKSSRIVVRLTLAKVQLYRQGTDISYWCFQHYGLNLKKVFSLVLWIIRLMTSVFKLNLLKLWSNDYLGKSGTFLWWKLLSFSYQFQSMTTGSIFYCSFYRCSFPYSISQLSPLELTLE